MLIKVSTYHRCPYRARSIRTAISRRYRPARELLSVDGRSQAGGIAVWMPTSSRATRWSGSLSWTASATTHRIRRRARACRSSEANSTTSGVGPRFVTQAGTCCVAPSQSSPNLGKW